MSTWAMDLGTTNTGIARWVAAEERVKLEELDEICRSPGEEDPLEAPRLIPSATHLLDDLDLLGRIGTWRFFDRRVFWGKRALIGRPALEANAGQVHAAFAKTFKPYLAHEASRPLARIGTRTYSAREVASVYIRELFAALKRKTGERVRDLVITTPVESFEAYRAELVRITKRLGVRRLRFIDEPVAAAIGYGLTLRQRRVVLVVDFGGGTLDLALVSLTAKDVQAGTCEVLAKEGRAIGGNLVDRWLLEDFCERLDYPLREDADDEQLTFWFRLMLHEACRVKEAVYFSESAEFELVPPEHMRRFEARLRGDDTTLTVDRSHVVEILEKNGLYAAFEECVEGLEKQARARGLDLDAVEDVLMVGGSTLLPRVYPFFEKRFGRDRVRAWQPFEAVAYGAAAFAAESFTQSDFIVHDYAFVTYDAKTHEPQYTVIVPRGTRIPTDASFWKRRLVPTCSLGEPETMFKLVVCEIGAEDDGERRFSWDAVGNVHKLGGKQGEQPTGPLVVPLNESNPTLGYLKPPHLPSDKKARLEISFGVNAERWLCATVLDLKTSKHLMKDESVVRLL